MPASGPLQSVADARRRAKRRLPRPVYLACIGGRGAGNVIRRNETDLSSIVLNSHVGDEPEDLQLATTVFGQHLSMPVILSPVGAQALRPGAEEGAARAAAKAGITFGLSNVASQPLREVQRGHPSTIAQLYWGGEREHIFERIRRYRDEGATGLIVTLDWSRGPGTDWDAGTVPPRLGLREMLRFAPAVLPRPQWLWGYLRDLQLPTLEVPQFATRDHPHPLFAEALEAIETTTQPTWEDLAQIKDVFEGPVLAKGIFHPDDARRAVEAGVDAISVSNHGGNTVDDKESSIRALPAVVEAVGDKVDVLMDGGVYRGADVVKALALGAKAVMIGRGYLWALAARGEKGVSEVLEIYRSGIEQALRTVRVSSVHDLRPEHIITPDELPGPGARPSLANRSPVQTVPS